MNMTSALHAAIEDTGLPIVGVSVGKRDDKTTWSVQWLNKPTKMQEAAAQAIITAFDPVAEEARPKPPTIEERLSALEARLSALEKASGNRLDSQPPAADDPAAGHTKPPTARN